MIMNRRRATSTTSLSGPIQRNIRYITQLRRKIRNLEDEAAELSQRLSMLLTDMDGNRTEDNNLRNFEQEVEQQVQLQDALNFSLEEEIRELRQMVEEEPERQSFDLVDSQPSTSQAACHPQAEAEDDKDEVDGDNRPETKKPKARKSKAKKSKAKKPEGK